MNDSSILMAIKYNNDIVEGMLKAYEDLLTTQSVVDSFNNRTSTKVKRKIAEDALNRVIPNYYSSIPLTMRRRLHGRRSPKEYPQCKLEARCLEILEDLYPKTLR